VWKTKKDSERKEVLWRGSVTTRPDHRVVSRWKSLSKLRTMEGRSQKRLSLRLTQGNRKGVGESAQFAVGRSVGQTKKELQSTALLQIHQELPRKNCLLYEGHRVVKVKRVGWFLIQISALLRDEESANKGEKWWERHSAKKPSYRSQGRIASAGSALRGTRKGGGKQLGVLTRARTERKGGPYLPQRTYCVLGTTFNKMREKEGGEPEFRLEAVSSSVFWQGLTLALGERKMKFTKRGRHR